MQSNNFGPAATISPNYSGNPVISRDQSGNASGLIDPVTGGVIPLGGSAYAIDCCTQNQAISAFAALSALGGGVIRLHGRINLTAPLSLASDIVYQGDGYSLIYTQYPDSGSATLDTSKGTVLIGDGTFPAFSYNTQGISLSAATTAYGAPGTAASSTNFSNTALTGVGIVGIGLKNFSIGIQAGSQYKMSFCYSYFDVCATDCTQWGFWIENFQHCDGCQFYSFNNAIGNAAFVASGSGYLAPGNSYWNSVLASVKQGINNIPIRNAVFLAYNSSALGSMAVGHLQGNRFSQISSTQAATMSNGSTSIGVTDLTAFAVGMPVTFSSTSNGFTVTQIYFVLSVSGSTGAGTITVGNTQPSLSATYQPVGYLNDNVYAPTAISATGSTAINIITQGFPCIEVVGLDNSASVPSFTTLLLDAEGGGTTKTLFQNCASLQITAPATTADSSSTVEVCGRNIQGSMYVPAAGTTRTDLDGYCTLFTQGNMGASSQTLPIGMYQTVPLGLSGGNGLQALSLNFKRNQIGDPTIGWNRRGNNGLEFNSGLQFPATRYPTAGTGFSTDAAVQVFNSASGSNTLPVISEVNLGWVCWYYNASQSGVAALNVQNSQLINRAYGTISVPQESSVCLIAVCYGGTNYGWMITGSNGLYVPTSDSSGSPGAATQQTGRGTVSIAAAGTSVVVTNPNVTTASHIIASIATADSTATLKNVVASNGSFTITLGAAATATTKINYLIVQ